MGHPSKKPTDHSCRTALGAPGVNHAMHMSVATMQVAVGAVVVVVVVEVAILSLPVLSASLQEIAANVRLLLWVLPLHGSAQVHSTRPNVNVGGIADDARTSDDGTATSTASNPLEHAISSREADATYSTLYTSSPVGIDTTFPPSRAALVDVVADGVTAGAAVEYTAKVCGATSATRPSSSPTSDREV